MTATVEERREAEIVAILARHRPGFVQWCIQAERTPEEKDERRAQMRQQAEREWAARPGNRWTTRPPGSS